MLNNGQRISQIISKFGLSKAEFARKIGEKPQTVSNWVSRDNGKNVLDKIIQAFPEINPEWLMTGYGDMTKGDSMKSEPAPKSSDTNAISNDYETYLLPQSAMGGTLAGFPADGTALQNCEKVISPVKGVDFAITVYGDSMAPEYPSGSRVLIKRIKPEVFIDWGKAYVLDTSNGVIIKEVLESAKKGCIRCHSINPDPKFSDFDVPMSEIYGIYRVLMCLSAK